MLTLFLLTVLIYHRCFRRYDADPEPELGLPAKRLTFLSGPNRLQGYLCGTGDTLAVLAPGLGNGAFSYAPQIQWLARAGLRVFSFDYTGCYGSTGRSCRGFPQAADDLRAALRFLEENGRFGSRRLVLLGHSMGGYAVCCALPGSRVDAAVCIGGVNSPMEATLSPVLHHIGVLAYAHYPALYLYQAARFGLRALRRTAAQAAAGATADIPIVGCAITDYAASGLVQDNDKPGTNVTGASDLTPVAEQLEMMQKVLPDVKKVGLLYCTAESNSDVQIKAAKKELDKLGLEYTDFTVSSSNEIQSVVESAVGKVDALYSPTDNTIAAGASQVGQICKENKLPFVTGEEGMCKAGGLFTLSINYEDLGYAAGEMAVKILKGEAKPEDMAIEHLSSKDLVVVKNDEMAEALGIDLSALDE